MYSARPPSINPNNSNSNKNNRLSELLEAVKQQVDAVSQEAVHYKLQRDELEHKLSLQMNEFTAFQQSLYELEKAHQQIKTNYELDIAKLKKELENRGLPVPALDSKNVRAPLIFSESRPPILPPVVSSTHGNGGLFGAIIGSGSSNSLPPKHLEESHKRSIPQDAIPRKSPKLDDSALMNQNPMAPRIGRPPLASKPHPPPVLTPAPLPSTAHPAPPKPSSSSKGHLQHPEHEWKKGGDDWSTWMNPKSLYVQNSNLSVDLVHSLDHESVVCCVKFSPDGNYLATGCNHYAQIYTVSTGRKICTLMDESVSKGSRDLYIRAVCFSPDGKYLVTGAEDFLIRIWDIAQAKICFVLSGHEQDIYSLDWSIDGKVIVSGSGDKTIKVWDVETGKCRRTLSNDQADQGSTIPLRDSGVTSVAISHTDNRLVAAGSLDDVVRIWDIKTGYLLEKLVGHSNSVYSVSFSPNGRSIVSGALDKTLKLWDLSSSTLDFLTNEESALKPETIIKNTFKGSFAGHGDFVLSVAYPGSLWSFDDSDKKEWIVSGSKDRTVTFWDATNKENMHAQITLQGHKNSVISIALANKSPIFATGSGDHKARIWKMSKNKPQETRALPAIETHKDA